MQEEGLPAEQVNGSYRVNPAELLEWATNRKLHVSPAIFQKMNGDSVCQTGLSDALAMGDGIAIPHPRSPMVMAGAKSVVRLGFLKEPIDFDAPDGQPVHTLSLMICPTVRDHLQQLARLATVLRDESFRGTLREKSSQDVIVKEVRRIEESFHGSA